MLSRLALSAARPSSFSVQPWQRKPDQLMVSQFSTTRKEMNVGVVQTAPPNIRPYLQLMRVDKPIGTWLLYWPCAWSIALATPAGQLPSVYLLSLFGAGSFLMRSAGCVINDIWDKDFDKKVERTKMRPLACGALSQKQAVGLLGGLLSASLAILLQLNWYSVLVGASSMALVVGYPLAKRYTYWPQFVLEKNQNWIYLRGDWWTFGRATSNWSVLILWAHTSTLADWKLFVPLYVATVLHTATYDTIYSHQDKADDVLIGVKSTALRFGEDTKKWLTGFAGISVASLAAAGHFSDQTWPYYLALSGTAAQLGWQVGTVNIHDGEDCWRKFKSNQWMGAILFTGIVASTLLKEKKEDDDTMAVDF